MTAVYWRLKSLQELQHHRGRERERERLGVAGRGLDYLHPSPSPGAVISCFALYALLFTLLMKNSVHVLFGFFFFLNRKSFEFFKMKRNLITYKNQKIHEFFFILYIRSKIYCLQKSVGSALKVHSF